MSDPVADFLTRIRNALLREHSQVTIPSSNLKENIAKVLKSEGFIKDYDVEDAPLGFALKISLKYDNRGDSVIREIKRVSRPGLRVFKGFKKMKPLLNGQGAYVVSTSKGLMSDAQCRQERIGGEVLCSVS